MADVPGRRCEWCAKRIPKFAEKHNGPPRKYCSLIHRGYGVQYRWLTNSRERARVINSKV